MQTDTQVTHIANPLAAGYQAQADHALRLAWGAQRDAWLRAKGRRSSATRRAYETATVACAAHIGLDWHQIGPEHIRDWQAAMVSEHLRPATINQRISAVSSFYTWVLSERPDLYADEYGRPRPNPCRANVPRQSKAKRQAEPLLASILSHLVGDINTACPEGARDAALLRTFLLTGWRAHEVLAMRWGCLRPNPRATGQWLVDWSGKGGKEQTEAFPAACYEAICNYLSLTGRLSSIQPTDWIWAPLRDHGTANFPNATPIAPAGRGAGGEGRHISPTQANNILRKRLRRALIATGSTPDQARTIAQRYHVHSLRHTFAYTLYYEVDVDILTLSHLMHHGDVRVTQDYIDSQLRAPLDRYSGELAAKMGI